MHILLIIRLFSLKMGSFYFEKKKSLFHFFMLFQSCVFSISVSDLCSNTCLEGGVEMGYFVCKSNISLNMI